jgi:prepilin-type N-terminal cleavage/methylation domain-containing protein
MNSECVGAVRCRQQSHGQHRPDGFSLLEMMMVVTLILIVASIATPIYRTCAVWTREALLRDHPPEAVSSQPSAFSERADS